MPRQEIASTARLLLRQTSEDDIPVLHERIFADAEVIRFVFAGRRFSLEESAQFIHEQFNFADEHIGLSTLVERASGEVIGFSGLEPCTVLGNDDLELGFVLAKSAWGKGYAFEIGRAQIEVGLDELGCSRLLALAHPENARSIHVIGKLGMRHTAERFVEGRGWRHVYAT